MAKQVFDVGTNDVDTASGSKVIQTAASNLDIVEFVATQNFKLISLDEFEFIDNNSNIIFTGVVRNNNDGDVGVIYGFDYGIELAEIPIKKNFEDMTPLEIIQDVVDNFTGLTYIVPVGIVDGSAIPLYPSQDKHANIIIEDMHKLLGTTHYMDVRNFNIEYEGPVLNINTLTVGVNCATDSKGWVTNTTQLARNVTVNGATKEIEDSDFINGDNVIKEFLVSNPYVEIQVFVGGVKQDPEIPDITVGDYEIRQETKKIIFKVAPPVGVDNIEIKYVYQIQTNYTIREVTPADILTGINPHHKIVHIDYLKEVQECKDYATKYHTKFNTPLREVVLVVNSIDLTQFRANERIRVVDNIHNVNGSTINEEFIIKKISRSFGSGAGFMELTVGDSTQFVYDRSEEISQRIRDFNETNPKAEIFNEGVTMTTQSNVQIQYEIDIDVQVGDLPTNVLVYDANRQYTNESGHVPNDGYVYIDETDYLDLFNP